MINIEKVLVGAAITIVAYLALVLIPITFYTEVDCLQQGYPEHRVTIDLDRYCIGLEGAVVPVVIKQ